MEEDCTGHATGTFHFAASPTDGHPVVPCLTGIDRALGGIASRHPIRPEPVCRVHFTCAGGMQNPWMPWFQFRSCFTHCHVINIALAASFFFHAFYFWMHIGK